MKQLKFKRLTLISDTQKSANQFEFQSKFNLITGENNSVGKSTLIKSLLWALGCDPYFDEPWKSFDCKGILEFTVGDASYLVARYNNMICLGQEGKKPNKFAKITGEYSRLFADIVNFKVLLPNKYDDTSLDVPPPAYYFAPFYIDQKRSWIEPWNNFKNLQQYSNWKQTIIKYHTGYIDHNYFDIEKAIYEKKRNEREINADIVKINSALEVVEEYVPQLNIAISEDELNILTNEINVELSELCSQQESLFGKLTKLNSEREHYHNQEVLAELAINELEGDYRFAVENVEGDKLECPICGTMHDNSIINRTSLLVDKHQTVEQLSFIRSKLADIDAAVSNVSQELEAIEANIKRISEKYIVESSGQHNNIIDSFASRTVHNSVAKCRAEKQAASKSLQDSQANLKKEQRKLLSKKYKDELNDYFMSKLVELLYKLNATETSLSKVKGPTDYQRIIESGGAAESTRAVLAYQMSLLSQIYSFGNAVHAPFLVDTPNQQDQAKINYQRIIDLLLSGTPPGAQVILCAMEREQLSGYKNIANVIALDSNKLLLQSKYYKFSDQFSCMFTDC